MSDIIRLLPDAVANQIAAGEVIQRPASAVKELLENAVDSGATQIDLVITNSGKTLIQVVDNGCGLSPTDARMAFERHATSKIKDASDLFKIHTFGFRGEALASIAAIAQLELRSRRHEDELGTHLIIEGSVFKDQQPCACSAGTSIMVKNLFFNVPARRNFLKSDQAEFRHILEEFQRVALVNPEISFSLHHNGKSVFQLPPANLKQRIGNLLGSGYYEKLIPVSQETDVLKISGYVGKPESSKRTRGDQYFFANSRYIRHPYFNHAVEEAFQDLIPEGHFPTYFIYLEVDPASIDINIHPTKTEVNFQEHQVIYAMLRAAVKLSIGRYSVSSTLDFETGGEFDTFFPKNKPIVIPTVKIDPEFNPFESRSFGGAVSQGAGGASRHSKGWERLYESGGDKANPEVPLKGEVSPDGDAEEVQLSRSFMQLHNKYVISKIKSGLLFIDQQAAHERILYERFLERIENRKGHSQQQLFPHTVNLSAPDAELLNELMDEFTAFGFDIGPFGQHSFVVQGVPADVGNENIQELIEKVLENYKSNQLGLKLDKKNNLSRCMARNMAIKPGKTLLAEEMQALVDDLFACQVNQLSPSGKRILLIIPTDEIEKRFG
ncbi:MAG: DNA mismatch repair endonuclease MutL [Lentimicrobium sp.]|jgi:DNA mismatch repair protein MutL|nr:DNA mismatch repair endonuclease MutL [Lentimicrobium sp.]MDD2526804.1 DNA mismatch repair endonuclease MutL [Lentimicrobiaceae bacterium]MDD4597897.1 DNA mismatch repair endonuclease MutL [Lentimicrobiaceae bacterium]MDY0024417.1 DNA mismatch repair endonuclease MutL [Lentimicrobium sp.]